MAYTIIKKKKPIARAPVVPGTTPERLSPSIAEVIDNYGRLAQKLEPQMEKLQKLQSEMLKTLGPLNEARTKLDEEVQKYSKEYDLNPDEPVVIYGKEYVAEVGKAVESRTISNLEQVKKFMGTKLFMELATVTLGNVDKYLTLPQREEVLTVTHGKRKINKVRLRA